MIKRITVIKHDKTSEIAVVITDLGKSAEIPTGYTRCGRSFCGDLTDKSFPNTRIFKEDEI